MSNLRTSAAPFNVRILMTLIIRICIVVVLVTLVSAQTASPPLDAYMQSLRDEGKFSGVVLVARGDNVVFEKAYGMANVELTVPLTTTSKFRIGSVTKQFTAAAILLLQDRGILRLQDTVCRYLDPCPQSWSAITIQNLLTHRSGIPDVFAVPEIRDSMRSATTLEKTATTLQRQPLAFAPGAKFQYSNSGYLVLALVVQRVSGSDYASFIRQNILVPLGLHDTGNDNAETVLPQRAAGYTKSKAGEMINAPFLDMSVPLGGGSMYSTATDLFHWTRSLQSNRLLSASARNDIFSPHGTADWGDDVGYGWYLGKNRHGHAYAAHLGGINGFAAYVGRFPDRDLVMVILTNRSFAPLEEIALKIDEIVSAAD